MPLVTGTLTDFGLDPINGTDTELYFKPSGPAFAGLQILADAEVRVETLANGYFEVDLVATTSLAPAVHYTVGLSWRDEHGMRQRSELPWWLIVPDEGGALGDLLQYPGDPAKVWIGTEPPEAGTNYQWYLNETTGDLYQWKG